MRVKKVRKQYTFSGRVQGVGFRFTAEAFARSLGLTGWVRNDWDGTVTMEVQGQKQDVDKMIRKLHSSNFIRIENMCILDMPLNEEERSFRIR